MTVPGSYSAYAGGIYCSLYGAGTVENCYFLDSSAASAGFSTTGTVTEPDEMTAAQSADVFASGKIAWYLNHKGGNTETVWFQNVDNDRDHNEYPVLDSESAAVPTEALLNNATFLLIRERTSCPKPWPER